jgi:hypothetical protein
MTRAATADMASRCWLSLVAFGTVPPDAVASIGDKTEPASGCFCGIPDPGAMAARQRASYRTACLGAHRAGQFEPISICAYLWISVCICVFAFSACVPHLRRPECTRQQQGKHRYTQIFADELRWLWWETGRVGAIQTYLYDNKMPIPRRGRDMIRGETATDPTRCHAACGLHHARSSGGPLRIDSQASTGISRVKTMTSR